MVYTIAAVLILIASFAGLLFVKNGELSGLGREHARGSFRSPHGRLVRTKRLDSIEESGFVRKLAITGGIVAAITVVVLGVCLLGIIDFGSPVALFAHFVLVMLAACALSQLDAGIWRSCAFAMAGYLIMSFALSGFWYLGVLGVSNLDAATIDMLTMVFGAIGAVLGIVVMPTIRTYAREFEDGHVNTIRVSSRSTAAKAYDLLLDQSWKPPADRIAHPEYADNPRKARGGM